MQNAIRANYGVRAVNQLCTNRGSLWWRFWRACLELHRAIPRPGLRTNQLPRESVRHRSLPAGQPEEAVWYVLSSASQMIDAGRCQRGTRLAYLGRFGDGAYPSCASCIATTALASNSTIQPTPSMTRPSTCTCRFFHGQLFRATKAAVKMHTLLDLRGNSGFHPYLRRQDVRCQGAGYIAYRSGGVLRDGSRLPRLHSAVRTPRQPRKRGEDANLVRHRHLRADCHC